MGNPITYENEQFQLVSGTAIIDKETDEYLGSVRDGGIEWKQPDWVTKRAVSAFIGECAMHGVTFTTNNNKEN